MAESPAPRPPLTAASDQAGVGGAPRSAAAGLGCPAAKQQDDRRVTELLGREPAGQYEVVVRDSAGDPVVIRNVPLMDDGTPMPTLYWLVGKEASLTVSRLESGGAVRRAEAEVDPEAVQEAHDRYAAEREALIPAAHRGPRPSGGVGGTRKGVKCLHAHYAWFLAGGDDPVGRWVDEQLRQVPA